MITPNTGNSDTALLQEKLRQAEATLLKYEERLHLATEAGKLGTWEWDLRSDRISWSREIYRLHGMEPGQFDGTRKAFLRLVHEADREMVWEVIRTALASQDSFSTELRAITPQGDIRRLLCDGRISRDKEGEAVAIIGTTQDITAQKRAEERLQLLDNLSQAARDAVNAKAIMTIATRMLGEYLNVARCVYADVETDNDCFTIRDDWHSPGTASSVGVYSLSRFGARTSNELRQGRTLVIHDVRQELTPYEDTVAYDALNIKAIISCPRVKGGRLIAMLSVHHHQPRQWLKDEISLVQEFVERSWAHIERVRANELMHEREIHLRSLFEQTAAGICETDLTGTILRANNRYCEIVQRRSDQVIGRTMQSLTHPDDLPRNLELFKKAINQGEPFEIEKRYIRPDGSAVWVSNTVTFIRTDENKSPGTMLAVVLDITARKQAEEELRRADRRKDEFLAMLAHELRNPLAPISAAADILAMTDPDATCVKITSDVIRRQVNHMSSLVDDLLDVSRVTRGLVTMQMAVLDAKAIVSDAIEQIRPLIEEKRHHLGIELTPETAHVIGDQKRLVQVLTNLLNNAVKYTPPGGGIQLLTEVNDKQVMLHVKDNGIGIEKELQPYVFELFAQAKRAPDRSQGGLGIGLALVKSLVELHHGSITCISDGAGRGSLFSVCLPRHIGKGGTPTLHAVHHPPIQPSQKQLTVLVVDDNRDAARMLAMFVEVLGHRVFIEYLANRALETAANVAPDVCLLDIGLPGMDGKELARHLRSLPATASATLVAVTGYGSDEDKREVYEAGFDLHFAKPIDTAALTSLLRETESRLGKMRVT